MLSFGIIGELSEAKQLDWKIDNFSSLTATPGCSYSSPSFTVGNIPFHLCIYPGGEVHNKFVFLSVFIFSESPDTLRFTCTLGIRKTDGTLDPSRTGTITGDITSRGRGYCNFCERSILEQHESEYLQSGILTICCILKINSDHKSDIIKANLNGEYALEAVHHGRFTDINVLSDNFRDLFSKEDSCDVVLQVKDKEFKAHRTVLMARSLVFAAMFQHDSEEKKTGFIKIPDCDPESFRQFLEYVYCGKIDVIAYSDAIHLYTTSDKYDLKELKAFCIEYLTKSLTADNICEVAILANKYDETNLLSAIEDFFTENFGKVFFN